MAERVSADHPSVETVHATLARAGRTDRPKVALPEGTDAGLPAEGVVRLVLDGRRRHAPVERGLDGAVEIRGAYDNARMARERDGENRLLEWAEEAGLGFGRSVLVDVVEPGSLYGLRRPGKGAVYEATDGPDESLASIAERIEDG